MKKKWIIVIVVIILLAPLGIAIGTSADILNWATNDNDWIGFWGGYVGTFVGSMITLFVLYLTLQDNEKARKRDEKLNYYNQILDDYVTFINGITEYLTVIKGIAISYKEFNYDEFRKVHRICASSTIEFLIRLKLREEAGLKDIYVWADKVSDEVDDIRKEIEAAANNGFERFDKKDEIVERVKQVYISIDNYKTTFFDVFKKELEF